jgi:acyl-CoA dehydrogenase
MRFPPATMPPGAEELRAEVRRFIDEQLQPGAFRPGMGIHGDHDPGFSRALGARGWIGMTWPTRYGGGGRTQVERFVVWEELLTLGAPVNAHWIADRQIGTSLLDHGTEEQREEFLPAIARGERYFSLGMSEPESGSDLASVQSRAVPVEGGWSLTGTKLWTGGAHANHHVVVLCRTAELGEDRHAGLTQLIVDLDAPGVEVTPIRNIDGRHRFNRVELHEVYVPDERVLGRVGDAWHQVTSELAFERAGPERYLSSVRLLMLLVGEFGDQLERDGHVVLGDLYAQLVTLRELALSVAVAIDEGRTPEVEAALVKELGTRFEQEVIAAVSDLVASPLLLDAGSEFERTLTDLTLFGPAFTIQGGTNEVLHGIVARAMGVR